MTFTELHEAIAAAFGWSIEPCTSWVFNMVDQDSFIVTKGGNATKLKPTFTAYWTAPDQGYKVAPAQRNAELAVRLCMKTARVGKYWTYDYNISKQPHALKVIDTLTNNQAPILTCVGAFGNISRKAWQFAFLVGLETKTKTVSRSWVSDIAAPGVELEESQEKFEERKEREANFAAKRKAISNKRAAPSESGSAEADEVVVRAVKKQRVD